MQCLGSACTYSVHGTISELEGVTCLLMANRYICNFYTISWPLWWLNTLNLTKTFKLQIGNDKISTLNSTRGLYSQHFIPQDWDRQARVLDYNKLERLIGDKQSSLFGPICKCRKYGPWAPIFINFFVAIWTEDQKAIAFFIRRHFFQI